LLFEGHLREVFLLLCAIEFLAGSFMAGIRSKRIKNILTSMAIMITVFYDAMPRSIIFFFHIPEEGSNRLIRHLGDYQIINRSKA
jgi:hypothetical protein